MRLLLSASAVVLLCAIEPADARSLYANVTQFCGDRYCAVGSAELWGSSPRKRPRARPQERRLSPPAVRTPPDYGHTVKAAPVPLPRPAPGSLGPGDELTDNAILTAVHKATEPVRNLLRAFREEVVEAFQPVRPGYVAVVVGKARAVVARAHAWRFAGLLRDLQRSGVRILSVGGYRNTMIDPRFTGGRRIISKHASGLAVDVNQPARNVMKGVRDRRLMSRIAARWGLKSGGDWRSPDLGHFEVAGRTTASILSHN